MRFPQMFKVVPEGVEGIATISHFVVSKQASTFTAVKALQHRDAYVPEGIYCQLKVGRTLMMTDTRMEQNSNYGVVHAAMGNVLIAGLGIGMILLPILAKPEVTGVTVIEKYADVVKLVEPAIRKAAGADAAKLRVIEADIFEWAPPKGEKWDTIYFDIWPDICTDNLEEMTKLHRKMAKRKAPGGWMESWKRAHLKRVRERDKPSWL